MSQPVFILGAGFNADTAGWSDSARYPLLNDLAQECFGIRDLPTDKSIEHLFQQALDQRNHKPIAKLADLLLKSDYYISLALLNSANPYSEFLVRFPTAPILSFNYDGLVEILALHHGQWRPNDGFGAPVRVRRGPWFSPKPPVPDRSLRLVLHLHGSLYLYSEYPVVSEGQGRASYLKWTEPPLFFFDPDKTGPLFLPFERPKPGTCYSYPHERILAPVPNKITRRSTGLTHPFIHQTHERAAEILEAASVVVVIGYSFNPTDLDSYRDLLRRMSGRTTILVLPEAVRLVERLANEYPEIQWLPVASTFATWVENGYEGLEALESGPRAARFEDLGPGAAQHLCHGVGNLAVL